VVLGVLTASFGVTGYSLPWDQIGYWAVKIVTGVPDAIPVRVQQETSDSYTAYGYNLQTLCHSYTYPGKKIL
jgi:quinol-cytochrome oxidoreductase complex cytochrome b subunit